ncbi:MAG: hypothetical protein JSS81_02420 [Acidobacteria bacterium]|nr:hypothetical protein [Acidobacteriota bacterium]
MSLFARTANRSLRVLALGLFIALLSTFVLGYNWESVKSYTLEAVGYAGPAPASSPAAGTTERSGLLRYLFESGPNAAATGGDQFAPASTLIDPAGDGGFETGATFAANNWTAVNTATANGSQWFVTTTSLTNGAYTFAPAGSRAGFVSNNSGTNWRYNTTPAASSSHLYKDITFPAGETNINLSFRYNVNGVDTTFDTLYVYLCPQTLTPVANSPSSSTSTVSWTGTGTATLLGTYNSLAAGSGSTANIAIPGAIAGNAAASSNMRLVFTWKNDGSGGTEPPAAIDDVSLTSVVPTPISGTKTVCPSGCDYPTLTAAFSFLTANGVNGPLVLELGSTYVSTSETFPLAPGAIAGSSAVNTVTVRPATGATGLSISGSNTTALLDLNGASNVVFDGRPGGTGTAKQLTISNTSTATGGAAVRFINDASGNTLRYLTLKAAFPSTTSGIVNFLTTTGTTGNDNNTVDNCDIDGGAGALVSPTTGIAQNGIYASGSTTTTTLNNSGNTISNNNFFNIFSASSASNGVQILTGNTDWTIQNNSFYQTAARTTTTASVYTGIIITNTSGNNFVISGNYIGGSAALASGTTTINGTVASRYRGLSLAVGSTTASSVQGNTIAGWSVQSSSGATTPPGVFCGVYVTSGGAINIGTVTGNTIGATTGTGSITASSSTSGGITYGICGDASSSVLNIANNNIGSFTTVGTTASVSHSFAAIGVTAATTLTVNNNTIGSTTTANSINASNAATGTTAQAVHGILNTSSAAVTITNNTVANLNNAYVPSAANSSRIVGGIVSSGAAAATITGNTVRNLSTAANATGTGTTASVQGIQYIGAVAGSTVSTNTVRNISNTHATAATVVSGIFIQMATTGTNVVARNLVHSLGNSSTAGVINGIITTIGNATFQNNMVALGGGITTSAQINGLNEASSTNNFYHNSVYIGGTGVVSGTVNTFAFNSSVTTNTRAFRDNIFFNARSNTSGTGVHYAITVGGTTANPTGLTSNNNILFANGTGGAIGRFNSLTQATLANWQTATGQDGASLSSDPQFIDPTNATTPDLHLSVSNPTVAESNGVDVGVTDDFDGQTRASFTPVDIGADAGNFTSGGDFLPPVITYTALPATTSTTDRTLSISVTDILSAIPTSGAGLPVLYFRKGVSGAFSASQCVFASGSNYNCTFTYASVGGVTGGDTIQYYVAAQDAATTPNVAVNPATGASGLTANPPAASTAPTAPNSYPVNPALTGTKTVCASGCDYTGLTTTGGLFAAINAATLTGNVTVQIAGDLTAETGAVALNQTTEEPTGSNFTVKIFPTGAARAISGSLASDGLIRLNGADRVTIDGSLNGTGTDRSLTITNTNTTAPTTILLSSLGTGAGATNDTIKNLNVSTGVPTTSGFGIRVGAVTGGADNDSVTIQNNNVTVATVGIFANGTASVSAGGLDGLVISGNTVDSSAGALQNYGIEVGNATGAAISGNTVSVQSSAASALAAISLETGFVSSTVTGNTITKSLVTNTNGYGGRGITVATGTAASNLTIANNVVYGVNGSNWSSFGNSSSMGIALGTLGGSTTITTTTGGVNLYYNSVSMTGSMGSASTTALTTALYVGSNVTALDVRDNIFSNTQVATSTTQKNYAIYSAAANTAFTTINYNDYYVSNTFNAASAIPGFIGSDRTNLAGIQTGFGQNVNSLVADPQFNNPASNLQPQSVAPVIAAGTPIAGVTTDYLGTTRSATTPTMGAYETGTDTAGPTIAYTALANTTSTADRTLAITVTDPSGVPTSGAGLPVLYYRKGISGAFTASACSFASGSAYNCPIAYAAVGGVVAGDTIQYYVAAQDSLNNVSVNPATGASGLTANPPAAGTPPTSPSSYNIAISYSGSYTVDGVGGGGNFASLTNPGGIFEAINNGVLQGSVTINITADLTAETGAVALNAPTQETAGTFTITIKPSGAARAITGAAASTALLRFNGASNVVIDGSLSGGTDRSLTITNTGAITPQVVRFGSVGTTPITGDVLKNCVIVNGVNTSSAVIVLDTGGAAGYFNNVTIQNNDIRKAFIGIFTNAAVATGNGANLLITQNKLDNTGANALRGTGVYVQGADGATVSGNTIGNFDATNDEIDSGVWLATGTVNSTVSGNTVTTLGYTGTGAFNPIGIRETSGLAAGSGNNITQNTITSLSGTGTTSISGIVVEGGGTIIQRNNIAGVVNASTSTYGAYGINIGSGATVGNNIVVRNNFVSGVTGNMTGGGAFTTTFGIFGIRVAAGTGHVIANNSVNLTGLRAGTATTSLLTAALGVLSTSSTGMDVRNNILANNITGGTTSVANVALYLPSGGTSAMNLTLNNNSYYYGTDTARAGAGQAGTTAGTNFYTTLAALKAYSSTLSAAGTNDNASLASTGAVPFASATDLHIAAGAPEIDTGATIASVTNDFDGETRPQGAAYEIGADEITPPSSGTIQFSAATYSVTEGTPTVTLTVTRTGGSFGAVTANYALGGGTATGAASCGTGVDYVNTGGSVSFADGDTADKTFTVTVCDDDLFEAAETLNATLSIGSGAATLGTPNPAVVSITDNDVQPALQYSSAIIPGSEGLVSVGITVTRTGALDNVVAVDYATSNGTATGGAACGSGIDFIHTTGTLTFNSGETAKSFNVFVCDDSLFEPTETINLGLGNFVGAVSGAPASAVINLADNDPAPSLNFTSGSYTNTDDFARTRLKGDQFAPQTATITVQRTGATENAVTVDYATSDLTATGGASCAAGSGIDYVSTNGTLSFAAGETTKTFDVTVCTDALFEGNEIVNLTLSNPSTPAVIGLPNPAVLIIVDNETAPTFAFSSATYSNTDDFARLGETTKDFAPAVATITVNRTGALDNAVTVDYATSDGTATGGASCAPGVDYITTSGTLSFAAGDTAKTFTVTVCTDALFEGDETVDLTLSNPSTPATLGTPNSAVLTIVDNDAQPSLQFSSATYSAAENVAGGVVTLTVTRTGATGAPATVDYATSDGTATSGTCAPGVDYNSASGTLTFNPGDTTKTFNVTICDDSVYELNQTFTATLSNVAGAVLGTPNQATVTINNDDAAPTISINDISQAEGNSGTTVFQFVVTKTGATELPATVDFATADGTATSPADYNGGTVSLTFAPNDTAQGVNIAVVGDTTIEPDETFFGNLSNCGQCTISDNQGQATIVNDDLDTTPPTVTYTPLSNVASIQTRTISATVADNVAVQSVTVTWFYNGSASGLTNGCSLQSGTAQNGTWNCLLIGIAGSPTDPGTVTYYVRAFDSSGNSTANPAGANNANGTRNMYTVGSGGTIDVTNTNTFDNLVVGDGFTLNGNATVNGTLTLAGGQLNTGANTLTLGCNAVVTGAGGANYVVGTVEKQFCAAGSFSFPVGTTPDNAFAGKAQPTEPGFLPPPEFTPVDVNVTAGGFPVALTATVVDGPLGGANPAQSVSRYWDITKIGAGVLTADLTFHYLDQDVAGTEAGFNVLRRSGSTTATYPGGTVNAGANTATAPNVSAFSQWGAGLLVPTAANAEIAGRVTTAAGEGIRNATVMVTGGSLSEPRFVRTGSFGNYRITDLPVGENYVVTVISKRFVFANPSRVISLADNVADADFTADGQ